MKCGVRISKSELGDMFFYVIVNLISVIACEFAFASRKTMGITCVKDFVITYNYKIVPYMAIPVIMLLLISYFRRMYDDNIMRFDLSRCFSAKHYISENSVQNIRRADNPQRLRIIGSKVLFYL